MALGSDALGPRPSKLSHNRPLTFTVVGCMESRKNYPLILNAFEPMLDQIRGLRLVYAGPMARDNVEVRDKIAALACHKNSGFQFYSEPVDQTLRELILQSRATIYLSSAEGYGLPPIESLHLGTPVIASTSIPSLDGLGTKGIHYVEPLDSVNLTRAVLAFLDDGYANQKADETFNLNLGTWQTFTQEVTHWCCGSDSHDW